MKKSYYQLYTKLYDDYYLWVNFMNNSHLILNRELHDLYSKADDVENLKRHRKRVKIILKKVWQVNEALIDKDILLDTIQKLFDQDFIVDYYTQGGVCFAEMLNEVVVNYDGKVFKCTTIDDFSDRNSYGHLDTETGAIVWNEKITTLGYDLTKDKCKQCKMYPSCLGPCTLHLMNGDETCFLESLNLSLSEYMMFLYKNEMIRKKVYEQ